VVIAHRLDLPSVVVWGIMVVILAASIFLGGRGLFTLLSTVDDTLPAMFQSAVVFTGVAAMAQIGLWVGRRLGTAPA